MAPWNGPNQEAEKDVHADADHWYDTAGADDKGSEFQSKPF